MLVDFTTLSETAWTTVGWFQALRGEYLVSTVRTCVKFPCMVTSKLLCYSKLHDKFQLTS